MNHEVSITLTENDWGQIMDGLTCRAEQYETTARYHAGETVEGGILEVRDAVEARELARCYQQLAGSIRRQLTRQKT